MCAAAHRTPCKVSLRGRTAPVAIRSPLDSYKGITDSHDQCAHWSRNDMGFHISPALLFSPTPLLQRLGIQLRNKHDLPVIGMVESQY